MDTRYKLSSLSDDDLVTRLLTLVGDERQLLSDVLAHIAEVDRRKIYLHRGFSSMHAYCTEVLALPEDSAFKRIRAARLARLWPEILKDIATGQLSLSSINILAPHVAGDGALLRAARGLSTRATRALVAKDKPEPDMPDTVTPISGDRVVVRFCASNEFADKLSEAKALLSHSVPDGALEHVLGRALDALIEKTKKQRFAQTDAPRGGADPRPSGARARTRTRHIPAQVKREVAERDGLRCTFVGKGGRRCDAVGFIQYHHEDAYGLGGGHDPQRLKIICGPHNRLLAEEEYGKEHMAAQSRQSSDQLAARRVIRTVDPGLSADAIKALVTLGFKAGPSRKAVAAAVPSLHADASLVDLIKAALRCVT
jgi:hypothetical protein